MNTITTQANHGYKPGMLVATRNSGGTSIWLVKSCTETTITVCERTLWNRLLVFLRKLVGL